MKKDKGLSLMKRSLAFLVSVMLVFGLAVPVPVKAVTRGEVESRLQSLMSQYVGSNWNQYYYGVQCKGFATFIFKELFGVTHIGPYNTNDKYYLVNVQGADEVGRIVPGTMSADRCKALLQKGMPGDFIQVRRSRSGGPHSMILVNVYSDGIRVFDCNTDGQNGVKAYNISWNTFASSNSAMSLYHASSYELSDTCSCSTAYAGEYIVNTNSLALILRSGHGKEYPAIGSIPSKATVYVSKADGTWAHVEYGGLSGYCSMEYLAKKEEAAPTLNICVWLADWAVPGQMGESLERNQVKNGKVHYLCYELKDARTGKRFEGSGYAITERLYNPNGGLEVEYTYENSPYNWIRTKTSTAGTWCGEVEISGTYADTCKVSFYVPEAERTDLSVATVYYGDLDNNSRITISDISCMKQMADGSLSYTADQKKRADLNGDGRVDSSDLNLLLAYYNEEIKEFPVENQLASISILAAPSKLEYTVGESLNTNGLRVVAKYNNGKTKEIKDYRLAGGTDLAGRRSINVIYSENGISKTAAFFIIVKEKPVIRDNSTDATEEAVKPADVKDPTDCVKETDQVTEDTETVTKNESSQDPQPVNPQPVIEQKEEKENPLPEQTEKDESISGETQKQEETERKNADEKSDETENHAGNESIQPESDTEQKSDVIHDEETDQKMNDAEYSESSLEWNVTYAVLQAGTSTSAVKTYITGDDEVTGYTSSDPAVASVDENGRITGKKVGRAQITAVTRGKQVAVVEIKVQRSPVKTKRLKVNRRGVVLEAGDEFLLETEVYPLTSSQKVKYQSANPGIAAVSSRGRIKAKNPGNTVIRVKSGKKSVKIKVKVF